MAKKPSALSAISVMDAEPETVWCARERRERLGRGRFVRRLLSRSVTAVDARGWRGFFAGGLRGF